MGIDVVKKDCTLDKNKNPRKGNLDVELAADAMSLLYSKSVDTIILVSGDGDFAYLGEQAKRLGKRFEVVSFKKTISQQLLIVADKVTYLGMEHLLQPAA